MVRKEKNTATMKNRCKEDKGREQRKVFIKSLVDKHGGLSGRSDMVDMDELRVILTKLQDGQAPLPKDLLWCMTVGDKDGSGELSKGELNVVLIKYDKYKEEAGGILKLITIWDKNNDLKLSNDEMLGLLKEATGSDSVTMEDVAMVHTKFAKYSKNSPKGQIDADALAKAISIWDDEKNLSEGMFANGILPDMPGFSDLKMPDFQMPDHSKTFEEVKALFAGGCCCSTMRPTSTRT
eukprot:CAMPEP_0180143414 /NCGR_PEP_ID=MMETSP0986-20121125/16246_1 /TAXON_ID=697907 /ORGANISM="non described non described, Strain CCMP2293" /LENGTH=236 /DNA_ID=CAMNT_0022086967 /DNA_START=26 /DNA_END=736 /DNA_ORIENTATION=+